MTIQKRKETKFKTGGWSIVSYYMEAKNTKEMELYCCPIKYFRHGSRRSLKQEYTLYGSVHIKFKTRQN